MRYSITVAAVGLLIAALFVYSNRTQEIEFQTGSVESLSIEDSSVVLQLPENGQQPVVIEDDSGSYTLPRSSPSSQLIISSKGIYWESGAPCVKWKNSTFIPASGFNKLEKHHLLGTIEDSKGESRKLYYSNDKS